MNYLESIEVENFKSYRGKILIPFKKFTAIIGPNGSGKSNLMDAISFVLGEKTSSLRVKKLSDLIHGAPIGKPISNRARVTATYCTESGEKMEFSRIIKGTSAENRINDKVVTHAEYNKEMEKINIFIKVKNFLVFQGQVESIAMKNPKERTQLFEEISGSGEFKEDYEKAKSEMTKAEQETQYSFHRKKGIAAERKEAKQEKDEADKYRKLRDDFSNLRLQLMLFKLFYSEREIEAITDETEVSLHFTIKREKYEEEIKKKKQEQGKFMRELSALEKKIQEKETELNRKRPMYIKAKENTNFVMKKIESAKKSLRTAENRHESHMHVIQDLQKQLEEIEEKRREFDGQVELESQNEGRDLELEESQITEYNRLKEEAAKRSTALNTEIEKLQREQQTDQEKLDAERRKKSELWSQQKQKKKELEESSSRVEKLRDYIETSRNTLQEHKKLKVELEQQVQSSFERIREINIELEEVMKKQGDAKVDRTESSRQKRRLELLETLRRLFPGVYGRVLDQCEPVHNRYKIAITKVLGKYMYAIVCDTEKTARDCIQYMKEQCAEPETFLPLDYIDAKPINDQLREIKEPRGVKLVIDVIKYELPAIKRALQFTCGNSLVCENADDARKVAFGQVQRHKAVALDGTLFQKSGVISGGATDLKRKAQRWDEKVLDHLQSRKEKLTEELKQEMKKKRKEADLKNIISQIGGLQNRIKYSQSDLDNTENRSLKEHTEVSKVKCVHLSNEMTHFQKVITAQELKMEQKREQKHSLLQQCKMEDIPLPLKKGAIEDIDESVNIKFIFVLSVIIVSKIFCHFQHLELDEVKREGERLQSRMNEVSSTIQRFSAPNMKALSHLDEVKKQYHESKDQFDSFRKRARKLRQDFEMVKKKRVEHFNQCFDYVATKIDDIYKDLSRNNSAQAFLGPENTEEPYLEVICFAPHTTAWPLGNRFRPMDNLSGGEKTVAALALIFAIHDYQPSPFFVLDEIDAALDNTNIGKVAEYIKQMSNRVQCIVISLKEEFYNRVDALVGIYPQQMDGCIASKVISLDLSCYP
uniref:SMC hinge domain-containing protein n=1 Tax=Ciona savignyi TaxID=51511 RepID=H2YW15_CIOSA